MENTHSTPSSGSALHTGPLVTEQYATEVVEAVSAVGGSGDIEQALAEALMTAAAQAQQDLSATAAHVQATVAAKQRIRQHLQQVAAVRSTPGQTPAYVALLGEATQALQNRLNSLSDMSDTTSLRLQSAMDRHSRFIETLSNLLKKIGDTNDSLVGNLK